MRTSRECFFLIGVVIISLINGHQLSDKRKCADPKCEELISVGKTVNQYNAIDKGLLSYRKDADVKVYSKEAGSNQVLWGVEINGKKGYANKGFIKETKVFMGDKLLTHEVPVSSIMTVQTDDEPLEDPDGDEADDIDSDADDIDSDADDIDSDADDIDGSEIFDKSGEIEDVNRESFFQSTKPSPQLTDSEASQGVDNDQPAIGVPSDNRDSDVSNSLPSANLKDHVSSTPIASSQTPPGNDHGSTIITSSPTPGNDHGSSTPIASSPTPPGYNVLDGTTFYNDDESALPHYPSETQTPPPQPLPQMTHTVSPTEAIPHISSQPDSGSTPNLEVVPSGEPGENLVVSEVVSDSVLPTTNNALLSSSPGQDSGDSPTGSLPVLLSTLSGAVSDDSQVHATTFSVDEKSSDSNHASATAIPEESSLSNGGDDDDELSDDASKLDEVQVEPTAVENIFSSITSSLSSYMFESSKPDASPEAEENSAAESTAGGSDKSIQEEANYNELKNITEAEESPEIDQSNEDGFVSMPKPQDIINDTPNINELKTQEPDVSNNIAVERAGLVHESSSSLSPGADSAPEGIHEKDGALVGEGPDPTSDKTPNVMTGEGSDPVADKSSDPVADKSSDPVADESSDFANDEGSVPASSSDGASDVGSDSPAKSSDSVDIEHSESSDESSSAHVIDGDANSIAENPSYSNVDDSSSDVAKIEVDGSNNSNGSFNNKSPEQQPNQKFITAMNDFPSDVNPDGTVNTEQASSRNDLESFFSHPETTTIAIKDQDLHEKVVQELPSADASDGAVLSGSLSSRDGETHDSEELPSSIGAGEISVPASGEDANVDDQQHSQRHVSRSSRVNASKVIPIERTKVPGPLVPPSTLLSTKSDDHTLTSASSTSSIISPPLGQKQPNTHNKRKKFGSCFRKTFKDLIAQFGLENMLQRQNFASSLSIVSDSVIVGSKQQKKVFEYNDIVLFSSMTDGTSSTVEVTQDLETFLTTLPYVSKEYLLMEKHRSNHDSKLQILKGVTTDREKLSIEPKQISDSSNSHNPSMQEYIYSTVPDLTPSGDSLNIDPSDEIITKLEKSKEKKSKQNASNSSRSKEEAMVRSTDFTKDQKSLGYPTNWHRRSQTSAVSVTSHASSRSDPLTTPTFDHERLTTKAIKSTSVAQEHNPLLLGSLGSAISATPPKDDADDDIAHDPVRPKRLSAFPAPHASPINKKETEGQDLSGTDQDQQETSGLDLHDPNTLGGKLMQVVEPIMVWLSSFSQLGDSLSLAVESEASQPHLSSSIFLSLLLLAFGFIIVTLYSVHALLMKCSREGPLLEALNAMEHEQHVAAEVIMQLQEKLVAATSGSSSGGAEMTIVSDTAEVARLMEQLQQAQEEAANQAARIQELEQELEESTSSGLEMHSMLQDLLHEQRDTAGFQDSVDNLQKMLDSQREKVESLTSDLSIKTSLNDELKSEVKSSREKITKLEYQLEQVTHSLEEASSSKDRVQSQLTEEQSRAQAAIDQARSLTQSYEQASTALTELQSKHTAVEQKAERLQKLLRTKETELHVTKECLKQLKIFNDGKGSKEKLTQMLNVIKVQAQLSTAQQECSAFQEQLKQRAEEATGLEEAARTAKEEAARCLALQQQADAERSDALSKLAVLTKYFQEKEAQLTKELESESGLRHNAEGSAETVSSRIRDYDMQLLAYKTQVEGLKKELDDQEQSYRAQLAAQEQKSHESWVAARTAERKLDESKQETSQLRSRLLLASKEGTDNHAIVKPTPKHPEVSNGSVSSPRPPLHDDLDGEHSLPLNPMDSPPPIPPPHMLPPHMFPPPPGGPPLPPGMPPFPPPGMHPSGMHPPHPFLPPPPLPPMLSDRRLPPAGRLASPPFHRRSPPDYLDRHGPPSPPFDQRRSPAHYDRRSYSPSSEHSRYSDRQGRYSPDRHSERQYSDLRHHNNDRYHHHNNGGERHLDRYSPDRRRDSSSDRWLNRSPDGYARKPSPPRRLYDDQHRKGKKTSTPLGPNDR